MHRRNCPQWPLRLSGRLGGRARSTAARTPSPAAADLEPPRAAAPTQSRPVAMGAGERAAGGGGTQDPGAGCGARALGALCLLLSVGSATACLLLGAQAAALHGRVAALEQERELLRRAGPSGALAAWAETHLERLLREVRARDRRPGDVPCSRWGVGLRGQRDRHLQERGFT